MTTHEAALLALDAALQDAVEAGQPIPCRTIDGPSPWISDRHEDRHGAAEACRACPILDPCQAAGRFERFGVWGGRDVTVKPGKKLPPKSRPSRDPMNDDHVNTPHGRGTR